MGKITNDVLRGMNPHQRADALLGLLSGGGELPAEKVKEFLRIVQNATPLLKAARVVTMNAPTVSIPKILFAGAVMKPDPGDGNALSSGDRVAPTTSEVTLVAKRYMAQVNVGYQLLEDNVEAEEMEDTIMALLVERCGVDMETFALGGDTASLDALLAVQDGWLKRVTTNVVNAGSAEVTRALFDRLLTSVALRFRQAGKHAFYVEETAGEKWRSIIGDRATALGDKAILEGMIPPAAGRPVQQVGNMPVASNLSQILFTDPRNLILGIRKKIDVRTFDDSRNGVVTITVRTQVAVNVEHEAAASKATNVEATAA